MFAELEPHARRGVHAGPRDGPLDAHPVLARAAAVRVLGYTIFVAEVPSTLSEALLLEYLLARSTSPGERALLLTHAIDEVVGTFYTQVMFADFELRTHRLVEQGQPITADGLGALYFELLKEYNGDAIDYDELSRSDLGAHPALLQLTLLRLPVRDVLRVHGADRGRISCSQPGRHGMRP